jgi:hypothetical protein
MKIELRKVHYSAALSDETPAYSADIYVDGKRRGNVVNHGHGGQDVIYPPALGEELEAYAKTQPDVDCGEGDPPLPCSADLLLVELLEDHLVAAELRRKLRKRTLFLRGEVLYQTRGMVGPTCSTPPAAVVLNDLPFDEALVLFKKYAEQAPERAR